MDPMERHIYVVLLLTLYVFICTAEVTREPPSIEEPQANKLPKKYIRRGGQFQLPCEATGNPAPTYTWLHDRRELNLNKQDIKLLRMGTIQISNFQVHDQGEYQCVAANKYGKSLSQVFKVMAAILDESGKVKIQTYLGKIGRPLVLRKTQFYSQPESWQIWMTVRQIDEPRLQKLQHDKRIIQDLDGNLYFTALQVSDELKNGDFYKIEVHNAALQSALGGSYSSVVVDTSERRIDRAPVLMYLSSTKRKVAVLDGAEMRIQCIFSGYPDVDVTWSGPAKILATLEEAGTRLVLNKMTKEAAGEHECTGTNRAGSNSSKITVEMHTIPKFTPEGRPSKQTWTEGETATFRCQTTVDTTPQATIEWMINGVLVQDQSPGDHSEVTTIQNGKTLTIRDLNRDEDIKVVQCKAYNKHKTLYINAPLIVLKRTKLIETPVNQSIYKNTTQVILSCVAVSDPSTPLTIDWQWNGKAVSAYADTRMKHDKIARTLTLNLTGLDEDQKAAYSGVYMCTATNGYSNDTHTAFLEYREGPDVVKSSILGKVAIFVSILLLLLLNISALICILKAYSDKQAPNKEWNQMRKTTRIPARPL